VSWFLQTPDGKSPKLLGNIIAECGPASKGGAAFAFASAMGVKLLASEPAFQEFLKTSELVAVIGLDAITDTKALEELAKVQKKFPKFKPKVFLHDTSGALFHPKTMWLKTAKGGIVITGSGNLTLGGLRGNWEALAVQRLDAAELAAAEGLWNAWLNTHKKQLLELNDPKAIAKAKANKVRRAKIKKALTLPDAESEEAEIAVEAAAEEIDQELQLNPVLIAEVPKSGNRWKQVNFDIQTYQQFFGATLGASKTVHFYHVKSDGTLDAVENRLSVAVKSQNYRFEVGAAQGLDYPTKGHPIVIFEKVTPSMFKYVLLMPRQKDHALIQKYLDSNFAKTMRKRRITITMAELQAVWPGSPMFA
jgi:hypothetical protein